MPSSKGSSHQPTEDAPLRHIEGFTRPTVTIYRNRSKIKRKIFEINEIALSW